MSTQLNQPDPKLLRCESSDDFASYAAEKGAHVDGADHAITCKKDGMTVTFSDYGTQPLSHGYRRLIVKALIAFVGCLGLILHFIAKLI
jgi:hypothetical protein